MSDAEISTNGAPLTNGSYLLDLASRYTMPSEEAPESIHTSSSTTRVPEDAGVDGPPIQPIGGYDHLAEFMAQDPSLAIVRRFGRLNMLSILHLQAELVDLESDLDHYALQDKNGSDSCRQRYFRSWIQFSYRCTDKESSDKSQRQWQTMLKIREVLRQYSTPT